jgi:CheY-like chemotaxis protein
MSETVEEKPKVLVLEDDLMFSVRIEKTLTHLGYAPSIFTQSAEAIAFAEQNTLCLALVNFSSEQQAPGDVVKRIKARPDPPPVLGYCSHVSMSQIRPNAMAAGCNLLVANSALTMRLPQLVAKVLSGPTGRQEEEEPEE